MKKRPLLVCCMILALAGCSSSNSIATSNAFQKKLDCSSKTDGIKAELTQMKQENGDKIVGDYTLDEVFYSPSLNTCVYGYFYREELCGLNYGCSKPSDYEYQDVYVIRDALANKDIYNKSYSHSKDGDLAEFMNKIAELKK